MKLPKGYTLFDATEHLKTEEDIIYFLEAACEGSSSEHIARAHAVIAQARVKNKLLKHHQS